MSTKTAPAPVNLAAVVHESEEAAREAAAAVARANEAQARAEQARQKAEAEQNAALRAYLDKLTREYPESRQEALTAQADARAALETAIREGGDVFGTYRQWIAANIRRWELESALQQIRDFTGQPARETPQPTFNFAQDIAAIVDRQAMELQDEVIERIRTRRANFLAGKG